jgi:error-prone DNA polymerase
MSVAHRHEINEHTFVSQPYVELHTHSAFSFLDGASSPEELAEHAAAMGYEAIALTDHDGLCGSLAFAHACKEAGIRAITGAELTLTGGAHITLYAQTAIGYANLCRLITLAHAHTRDGPGRRATPPALDPSHLPVHATGIVCLTGCAAHGVLARELRAERPQMAAQAAKTLLATFGRGNVFVEIQRPRTRGDRALALALCQLADSLGIPTVATGNVHAHHPRRAFLQDAFVAIRTHLTLDGSESTRRGNRDAVLRPPREAADRFAGFDAAVTGTLRLAERLEFDLTRDLGYAYPDFTAEGERADQTLARICRSHMGARYPNAVKRREAMVRLDEELSLIAHHGLAGFFLLHREILELARQVADRCRPAGSARRVLPPGRGRGSSVGSIVCYLTGLSHVDPVRNRLFLGRFLNRDMTSVPDIDLDFPRDIREGLIAAIIERYGADHAAMVSAFPTFRTRMAIRELGSALALPPADIERLAKLADGWSSATALDEEIRRLPDGESKMRAPRWRALAFLAKEAAGLPRHLSQHSGGMIVSARPLIEMVPVVPAAFPGRQMCQWDKDSCADAGFVKIDLLGLGMLSAVEECIDMIAGTRGTTVDLSRIDVHDPTVYEEIATGDTVGVFQIESRAQIQSILQTRPQNLDDLTVQVALIRPGPVSGGAVHPYVSHRNAKRLDPDFVPPYDHPSLAECLHDTLGVVVFQEQVLEVAMALAGFTPGQAEGLRRAMSRKRSRDAMVRMWQEFRDGAREREVDDETIRTVFTKLVGFSNFGFPKAHASAFAVLAYQSAWLRRHYPAEFLASLLNAQPMGFYPPATLVRDGARRGVRTLPPCLLASDHRCIVDNAGNVRVGLGYVRGLGPSAATLITERERGGPFIDIPDLVSRSGLPHEQVAALVRAGACDTFERSRRGMLWELGTLTRAPRGNAHGRQLTLALEAPPAPELPAETRFEQVIGAYETTGISTGWHMVALLRGVLPPGTRQASELADTDHGTTVTIAGLVVARQRPATAHGIVFLLIEDETGLMNVIVRPQLFEQHRALLRTEPLLVIEGRLERRGRNINVLARAITQAPAPRAADRAEEHHRIRAAAPLGQHFGRGRR